MIDEFRNYVLKATSGYLVGMGIYPNIAGYTHLLSTIYIAAKRGLRGLSVCDLYSEAGRASGKSGAAVERAIRNAINKCVAEGRLHVLNGYFGHEIFSEKFPPRSGELIFLLADKVRTDYTELKGTDIPDEE